MMTRDEAISATAHIVKTFPKLGKAWRAKSNRDAMNSMCERFVETLLPVSPGDARAAIGVMKAGKVSEPTPGALGEALQSVFRAKRYKQMSEEREAAQRARDAAVEADIAARRALSPEERDARVNAILAKLKA